MEKDLKYCKHCGELINIDAVICTKCGRQVEELKKDNNTPLIINNNSSSSAAAAASASSEPRRRHYSLFVDIIMLCFTAGLWAIWMLIRPKYE